MGDRRRTLSPESLFASKIPLPPLPEQQQIVARIEELAVKINEARGLRLSITETELPTLRSTMVTHALDGKWTHVRFEELCSLITDGTHQTPRYVDDGFMFLSAQNVKPSRFMPEVYRRVSAEDYLACIASAKPQKDDVLMTR
jgi:restriction endonuclease S subunit